MSSQACGFILLVGSTAVLARMLTPDDFGLLTMVMVVTGFVALFKDMGLSKATIQRSDVTHAQISTLFWINVTVSVLMVGVTAALAPAVAWFYHEPRLMWITLALAGEFIFGGLTVQHRALLRRQMRFGALAVIEIASLSVGMAVAITSAWYGAGYWALVLMHLATEITTAVGVWIMCDWRPGLPTRGSGVRPMLAYGGNLTGFAIVNYLARSVDKMLIGRYFEAGAAGLYGKAYQLLRLPIQQINIPASVVAIPTLSRLQNDPVRYRAYYRRGIELIVTAGMPITVFLFVAADQVVLTVLGEQWMDAVPIFRVLAPAAFLGTFNVATGWVYQSLGRTDRQLRWGALSAIVTLTGFAVGLRWGPIGVAAALSITACVMRLPGIVYCFHGSPLRLHDLVGAIWRPALASALAGAFLFAADHLPIPSVNVVVSLLTDLAVYAIGYLLAWSVLPRGMQTLWGIRRLVMEMAGQCQEGADED